MSTETQKPLHLFYCYARKDKAFRDELDNHLSGLKRQNHIKSWSDREILPGGAWEQEIAAHLDSADIILLLVSADFMASDYCYQVEMERALARHKAGRARVVPIILRMTDWKEAPFSFLHVLPTDAKPVSTWLDRDAAFYDITQELRKVIAELRVLLEVQEWFDKGKSHHVRKEYEEEVVALDHVIRLQPKNVSAYYQKGLTLFRQRGHYKEAIVAFDHVIRLEPEGVGAYFYKGNASFQLCRYEEAIVAFDQVIRLEPENADVYYRKGLTLLNLQCYEEAIVAFDQVIHLRPENADAYYQKGFALLKLQRYEKAIVAYDQVIRLEPENVDVYYRKGFALLKLQRYEEAIVAFDQVIHLRSENADAHYQKGRALFLLQRFGDALVSYEQAIRLKPSVSSYYIAKAEVYEELADRSREKAEEVEFYSPPVMLDDIF